MVGYVVVFAITAHLTRALIRVFGVSKRAITERAEELGARRESIPISQTQHESELALDSASQTESITPLLRSTSIDDLQRPVKAQDPTLVTGSGGHPIAGTVEISHAPVTTTFKHAAAPTIRADRWAALVIGRLDLYTYAALFVLVGLPIYFALDYAMPAQLILNVLCYFGALALPAPWRRVCHPALVASILMIVGIFVLSMCHGWEFGVGLRQYQTKTNYLRVLSGQVHGLPLPGAGDVLGSILQVSIVALALPMYQNRSELKRSVSITHRSIHR